MITHEAEKEISQWRIIFKQKEMEEQFQEQEIQNRSRRNVVFAVFGGIYAFFQLLNQLVLVQNSQMPSKFYLYYGANVILNGLYLIINSVLPRFFSFYHWFYMLSFVLNTSWTVYDLDFMSFEPRRSYSQGFIIASMVCCNIEGGTFIPKLLLSGVVFLMSALCDQFVNGQLQTLNIFRIIPPIALFALRIRHEELVKREIFLKKVKLEEMMSIIHKQIPTPFIIAKLNKKEGSMHFHTGNLEADKQLGIYNQETYKKFMENCFVVRQPNMQQNNSQTNSASSFTSFPGFSPSLLHLETSKINSYNNNFQTPTKKTRLLNTLAENFQELTTYEPMNTLKYMVRKKVDQIFNSKSKTPQLPSKISKIEKSINNNSIPTIQSPTKLMPPPQIVLHKSMNLLQMQPILTPDFPKNLFHDSHTPIIEQSHQQNKSNNGLLLSNRPHHPYKSKSIEDNILFESSLPQQLSNNSSPHHRDKSKEMMTTRKPFEFIDEIVLNDMDISEFNSPTCQNKQQQQQPQQLHINSPKSQVLTKPTIPQLNSYINTNSSNAHVGGVHDNNPQHTQAPPTSRLSSPTQPNWSSFYLGQANHQGGYSLDDATLPSLEQQSKRKLSSKPPESTYLPKVPSSYSKMSQITFNSIHEDPSNIHKPSNSLQGNLKTQTSKTKKKVIKFNSSNQQVKEDEKVNVEFNLRNTGSNTPPQRYTVRYRVFRTNEIFVVIIVESESYKNKYLQEKLKNKLLSSIRSHQHSLITKNFTHLQQILSSIAGSTTQTTRQVTVQQRNQQEHLTELLSCLLSMNFMHHSFILFNQFIEKSDNSSLPRLSFNQDESLTRANLTQLLRSITQSLSCEAKIPDKITLVAKEHHSWITSNIFLIKVLMFSILRYFTQHTQQYKITVSLQESHEQSENDNECNQFGSFCLKSVNPGEETIRIGINLPLYENILRVFENSDLFVFSYDELFKDELSGQASRQSAWLLRTSSQIISQLGPYARFHIDKDLYNEQMTVSFDLYKDLNILTKPKTLSFDNPVANNADFQNHPIHEFIQNHSLQANLRG